MNDVERYTVEEAHHRFARTLHGLVWGLLTKADRTSDEDERMVHAAHASCYHWLQIGTGLHHQRGEWLLAHVYAVLGLGEPALRHACRCLELTNQHARLMQDFDWAYAYEGLARAQAAAGNRNEALTFLARAQKAGQALEKEEDRKLFLSDLNAGDWHGVR